MPITYVVNGLRETITGGIDARFWTALAVLLVVLIGSLAISAASAAHQRQWTIARLHPDLVI
jgi:putative membrane protein